MRNGGEFMEPYSHVDSNVKKLLDMIYAPMYTKTLFAAIELELFSELEEGKLFSEVAEKLLLHPKIRNTFSMH